MRNRRIIHAIELVSLNDTAGVQSDSFANVLCDDRVVPRKDLDAYSIAVKRSNSGGRFLQGWIEERDESQKNEIAFVRSVVGLLGRNRTVGNTQDP